MIDAHMSPILPGDLLFLRLHGTPPPQDTSPLPISPELGALISNPITTPQGVSAARRAINAELDQLTSDPNLGLRVNDEVLYDLQLGLSESMQNALRYGGGIRRIGLARTIGNNVLTEVENLALDFPPACQHARPGQRPLRLGVVRGAGLQEGLALPDDEHLRGLHLIGSLSVGGIESGVTMSAGMYHAPIAEIPILGGEPRGTTAISRLVAWAVYGEPYPPQAQQHVAA